MRLRRFLRWQLDRDNNLETLRAVDGMRRFDHPTLLLWGRHDTNFGPAIAERLAHDIPGAVGIEWLAHSAHLPMLEEPERYAGALERFFADPSALDLPASVDRP
jgi:pimeloyl-ACP methyl ester carboxylesterase